MTGPGHYQRPSALVRASTAAGLVLALLLALAAPCRAAALVMRFLDVGQGDAILLTSEGKAALVDTGERDDIVDKLRALKVSALDLLLVSHNHADHLGGADAVLTQLPVRFYMDNELPAKTKLQEVVLRLLELRKVELLRPGARTITLGKATLRILPPPLDGARVAQNDASIGVIVELGSFTALLTGDSEAAELAAWLARGDVPRVRVLKAAHHGSRNGTTPAWIQQTSPEVVIISVGAGNDYGHPHAAALRYYASGGRRLLRTDLSGDIVVSVEADGSYRIDESRPTTPAAASTLLPSEQSVAPAAPGQSKPPGPSGSPLSAPPRSPPASTP